MLPAPQVSTTSPGLSTARSASSSVSTFSTNTGSTLPRVRIARQIARPSAAGDRRLARGVHLRHEQHVAGRRARGEVVEQIARARVAMRLEREHDAAARVALAHRVDRRGDLGRVMPVVVDDRDRISAPEPNV